MDLDYLIHKRRQLSLKVTLKQCLYSALCVIIVLVLYKAMYFKYYINTNKAMNNSSSVYMTSDKGGFLYSNEGVYMTVKKIRFHNCMNKISKEEICVKLRSCELISALSSVNKCKNSTQCRSRPLETKAKGCERRLPRAVIIGTYKSGTRELIDFLAMNPLVVIRRQPNYEVSYFDKNVDKGLNWYRNEMPFSSEGQITIEKSPSYFTSKEAPRRIYEMDKNIKLILLVRNPVDRTLSHLTYEHFIIREQFKNDINNCLYKYTFNRRIINENCFAVKGSFYDGPFSRYLEYFSSDQILVINSDDLFQNPCKVVKNVEYFLNLNNFINCDNFIRNNETGFACVKTENTNLGFCYEKSRGRIKLQTKFSLIKNGLQMLFQSHNERFFSLIGKRFNWN